MGFFRTQSSFGKLSTSLSNILRSIKDKVKIVRPITQSVALAVIKKIAEFVRGTAVAQWLKLCATNQKVTGSIPDGVIGIFH